MMRYVAIIAGLYCMLSFLVSWLWSHALRGR